MLMNFFLAQAAGAASTNVVIKIIPMKWSEKFEQATGLPPEVAAWGVNILGALIIFVIGYILAGFIRGLVRKLFAKKKIDPTIGGFVGNLAHVLIMTFVIITALGQLGVDTKTFAAVVAAAGLAIGLALQGSLANFAAGFLIVTFRPFKAGDMINGAGVEGVVEEVQIFCTVVNTADNKRVIVPNGALMAGVITNITGNETRRADLQFGVGGGQDLAVAHAALLSLANADARVLKDPPATVANTKFIDNGSQIELRAWCKTSDYNALLSDLIAKGPGALAAAGIKGPDRTIFYTERK